MESQLQWIIKYVTDSSDAMTQAMHQSNQEGFSTVRAKLDSIYDVVSKTTPERVLDTKRGGESLCAVFITFSILTINN